MRNLIFLLFFFIFFLPNAKASTVKIFLDRTYYYPDLNTDFIGFNKDIKVFCGSFETGTEVRFYLNENCYLCKLYNSIKQLNQQKENIKSRELVLENLLKNLKPKEETVLKTYSDISEELIKINNEKNKVLNLYYSEENKFNKLAKSKNPIFITKKCKNPSIEIENAVDIDFDNVLKILSVDKDKETAEVEVSKTLTLKNNSGIDISAEKAYVFFKKSETRLYIPEEFYFSLLPTEYLYYYLDGDNAEIGVKPGFFKGTLRKSNPKEAISKKNRVYFIKNLSLPANGLKKLFKVEKARIYADFKLISFPKYSKEVYKKIVFKPPFEIDTGVWKVEAKDEIFTRLYSELKDNKYTLYPGVDYSIVVDRKPIKFKHKNIGFFNKKLVIKLGYKITLFNNSEETKKVKVIDRVPFFEYDVETKNITISNPDCKMEKYGKIICNIQLSPNGKSEITVKYELITDEKTYRKL